MPKPRPETGGHGTDRSSDSVGEAGEDSDDRSVAIRNKSPNHLILAAEWVHDLWKS